MPPHLRNGRDLSAEQRLRYQLSPAAKERLQRARISFASAGRGFSSIPPGGNLAAGHGNSPSSLQSEGNFPSSGVEQVHTGAKTRREGTNDPARQLSNDESAAPPAYQPRRLEAGDFGLGPSSVCSDATTGPTAGRNAHPNGDHPGRERNSELSEPIQQPIRFIRQSPGVPEREDHADDSLSSHNHAGL
ncbi:hypothetical protein PTTG_06213, partial [Puccinia triticina 1-1 BBBD Race 1]